VDDDGDGEYERRTTFIQGYRTVHGMQWHDGMLWFTQTGAIHRAADRDGDGRAEELETIIPEGRVPSGGGHWWRSILIHQDRLYTSIGDSGNITDETGTERQKIWSFDLAGGDKKLFCSGLRNTEKLVIRPGTDEIWGMDHGSDWFGRPVGDQRGEQPITDWNPPDEMNHYIEGGFYGHPFIVGFKLPRYEYLDRSDIVELADRTIVPQWPTGAHWAPNAMCFYQGQQFPPEMIGDAMVAYHGSWNREQRSGYQVTRVLFEDGRPYGELPMVKFLNDQGEVLGRPVDVIVDHDGSLLISDDWRETRSVYRLRYVGNQ
jgi:glucose/arabinose dehydrogenase